MQYLIKEIVDEEEMKVLEKKFLNHTPLQETYERTEKDEESSYIFRYESGELKKILVFQDYKVKQPDDNQHLLF